VFHLSLSATIAQETNVVVVVSELPPRKAEGLITAQKLTQSLFQSYHQGRQKASSHKERRNKVPLFRSFARTSLLQFVSFVSEFLPSTESLYVVLHFASTLASSDLNHIDRIDPILNY
jgi:hypothetical protein